MQHLQDTDVSPNMHIEAAEDLDKFVDLIIQTIQAAVERHIPKRQLSPFPNGGGHQSWQGLDANM